MSQYVDALGKACPLPVIMAKKVMDGGVSDLTVAVDNSVAVENLKKLAASYHYTVEVENVGENFHVHMEKTCEVCGEVDEKLLRPEPESPTSDRSLSEDPVVFVGKEWIGDGSQELGKNLIRMFFFTMTQSDVRPGTVIFMNGGVKLAVLDEQILEHLKVLAEKGVNILVCGTCLNYYGLTDKLACGQVSNMYEIYECMARAGKVITL